MTNTRIVADLLGCSYCGNDFTEGQSIHYHADGHVAIHAMCLVGHLRNKSNTRRRLSQTIWGEPFKFVPDDEANWTVPRSQAERDADAPSITCELCGEHVERNSAGGFTNFGRVAAGAGHRAALCPDYIHLHRVTDPS